MCVKKGGQIFSFMLHYYEDIENIHIKKRKSIIEK